MARTAMHKLVATITIVLLIDVVTVVVISTTTIVAPLILVVVAIAAALPRAYNWRRSRRLRTERCEFVVIHREAIVELLFTFTQKHSIVIA